MKNNNNSGSPFIVQYNTFKYTKHTKLVDHLGNFHDKFEINEAQKIARENSLDLVCFNKPGKNDELGFCKIIDFGKWKYSEEKKKKKNNVHKNVKKEIRFSPLITDHDIEHKMKQVKEFLEDGDEVTLSMRLKGRQKAYYKEAEQRLNEIVATCEEAEEVNRNKSSNMINVRIKKGKKVNEN